MTDASAGALAGLCAGAAVHLLLGRAGLRPPAGRAAVRRPGAVVVAGAVLAAAVGVLDGTRLDLALLGLAVVVAAGRELSRRRRTMEADRRADQVLATCEALASDLRAGRPPVTALAAAAAEWSELAPVATAAELGADVPAALRTLAGRAGASQVRIVAAAWQVGHHTGAGLADTLSMAADRLRADRATARVVATEMAAATATARLLAALPVAVLLLGNGLGGDPVGFLLDTTPGLVCLGAGLALEYAGLCWLARIADAAAGRRDL
jgi:tight adherence protein B